MGEIQFNCPDCGGKIAVAHNDLGLELPCPHCAKTVPVPWEEIEAAAQNRANIAGSPAPPPTGTPEVVESGFAFPAKLPFFKLSRRKLLQQKCDQLMATNKGLIDDAAEEELNKTATALGLDGSEASDLLSQNFMREFDPIKRRMESTFAMTDEDAAAIDQLKRKYNVRLTLQGNADLFRSIFLLESTGKLPTPVRTGLMLDDGEIAYYSIATTWHQLRIHTRGYSGSSVSVPTGIKGVRFRFGGYTPIRTEEMTPLSSGVLCVTSDRLLFNGESKNTCITLKRIIDGHVYSDSLKIEKTSGKPDLFSMDAPHARYILSLIWALK